MYILVVSSRLSGGGSRTEGCCLDDSNVSQNVEMCSQGPALVKTPLPRGVCPAELEDKLTIYGTNTKQLVSFKNCIIYFKPS